MKPFWRETYRDQFFERAGLYLLYAFILSIAANPFIMWFVGLEKFNYIVIEDSYYNNYSVKSYTPAQQEALLKYKHVSKEDVEHLKEFQTHIEWITITALLGWCATSPRFQRGWPKIIAKIRSGEKI